MSLPHHWIGTALRKAMPPPILLPMTKWSRSEFTYPRNTADHATKPKLHGILIIPKNWHQQCTDGNCDHLLPCCGCSPSHWIVIDSSSRKFILQCILLLMMKWSRSRFTCKKSTVLNQVRKPKWYWVHVIPKNLTPTAIATTSCLVPGAHNLAELVQIWGRLCPWCVLLSMTKWSRSELMSLRRAASNQSQCCMGVT